MQLINCRVELKHRRMNHCVFSAAGANFNITFTIKDTKLYVLVVSLLPKRQPKNIKTS